MDTCLNKQLPVNCNLQLYRDSKYLRLSYCLSGDRRMGNGWLTNYYDWQGDMVTLVFTHKVTPMPII